MSVDTISLFFNLLALLCWIGTAAIAIGAIVRRVTGADAFAVARWEIGRVALWLAWAVAAVVMAGSLYYSKVKGYVPCELCWYQRICLYPMAVILLIAAWRRDVSIRIYAIPVLVISAGISVYHSWIQWFPQKTTFCTADVPCSTTYGVNRIEFVNLPFMALSAAVFMIALLLSAQSSDDDIVVIEEEGIEVSR